MSILPSTSSILLTATLTAIPATYFYGGTLLRSAGKSFFDNALGGSIEGIAGGVISAARNIFDEATKNFDIGQASTLAGQKLTEGMKKFIEGTGYQSGDIGKNFGQGLQTEWNNFQTATGVDPAQLSKKLSDLLKEVLDQFDTGGFAEKFGEKGNDAFDGFIDTFDLGEKARRLTEELRRAMDGSTFELGKGIEQAMYNTLGQVIQGFTFHILPYILAVQGALVATPLVVYYLYRKALYNIGRPKLATEVYQRTIFTPLTERVSNASSVIFRSKQKKPIFNPEITRRIDDLTRSTENIRKNNGYFQNVLFYGPGGTGKTMISEYIAKNSGMSYVKMSGGDLAQYIKRGEHVTELNKLLDKMDLSWRPWSTRPWILFIDEAESLCKDRSKLPSAELIELQNAFLNRTGTERKRRAIILSTNRMEDLDEAILSRMDHKIYIGPPAEQERFDILKSYIPQFFSRSEQGEFFKDPQVRDIARATDTLTGRALFKLLNAIANKKATTDNKKITQPIIDQTVKDMVQQEKEVERRRAQKEAALAGTLPKSPQPKLLPRPAFASITSR